MSRKNSLLGFLFFAVAVVWLLRLLNVFPPYIDDLLVRAAPVVLVIIGLSIVLQGRIPLSGLVSLLVGVVLVGGIGFAAFNTRQNQVRDDNTIAVSESIGEDVILLRLRLQSLATDVEVVRMADGNERTLGVRYDGSIESDLVFSYVEDPDGSATFTLSEIKTSPVPMLEAVGRGTMLVEVPFDVPVDVQLEAIDGDVRLNMSDTLLERLTLELASGDAIVTFPEHKPLFSRPEDNLGAIAVRSGALVLRVPSDVAARFDMSESTGGEPDYDPAVYNLLFGRDILEARLIDSANIVQRYDLFVSRDRLTVDVPES